MIHERLNEIDKQITDSMLEAERTCSKIYPNIPFSSALDKARKMKVYWKKLMRMTQNKAKIHHSTLMKLNPDHYPSTIYDRNEIRDHQRQAAQNQNYAIRNSYKLRLKFLQKRIDEEKRKITPNQNQK